VETVVDINSINSYLFGVIVHWIYTGSLVGHVTRTPDEEDGTPTNPPSPCLEAPHLIALYCFALVNTEIPGLQDDVMSDLVYSYDHGGRTVDRKLLEYALSRVPAECALGRFLAITWGAKSTKAQIEGLQHAGIPDAVKAQFTLMAWRESTRAMDPKGGYHHGLSQCDYHNHPPVEPITMPVPNPRDFVRRKLIRAALRSS
jgi:hypothetical protein